MKQRHEDGLFVAELGRDLGRARRTISRRQTNDEDYSESFGDPYIYPPLLSEYDIYLFSQGTAPGHLPETGRAPTRD